MKQLAIVLMATVGFAAMAQAADLPTTKAPAAAPPPNCWASFWTWLNTSATDCPIGAYGVTFYGTADLGYGYQEYGTRIDPSSDKVNYGLNKSGHGDHWGVTFNGLSTSVLGVKMKEDLAPLGLPGWSLIGVVEAGFNPTSGMLINGPRALADNNVNSAAGLSTVTIKGKKYNIYNDWQSTNFDSSRAGQWDNSQGFIGVSNNTWGTLTFGRTNSLSNDVTSAYDPVASTAFSLLGFSNSFAGFGNTELVRINTALTYRLSIPNVWAFSSVRLAGQAQIGGYGVGNAATQSTTVSWASTGATSPSTASPPTRRMPCRSRHTAAAPPSAAMDADPAELPRLARRWLLRPQQHREGDVVEQLRHRVDGVLQVGSLQVLRRIHLRQPGQPVRRLPGRFRDDRQRDLRSAGRS